MKKPTPLQAIGLIVLVLAIIVGVSKNRGAPVQQSVTPVTDVQQDTISVTKEQLEGVVKQGYEQGNREGVKQVLEALTPVQPEPSIRNAQEELANLGYRAIATPQGKVCGGDGSLSFGDVLPVPGRPDYYLWVNYERGFTGGGVDGEGCAYTILYIPPGSPITSPYINPMDCLQVFLNRTYPPISFTFGNGYTMEVVVLEPSGVIPNGFVDMQSGVYCYNGSYLPSNG